MSLLPLAIQCAVPRSRRMTRSTPGGRSKTSSQRTPPTSSSRNRGRWCCWTVLCRFDRHSTRCTNRWAVRTGVQMLIGKFFQRAHAGVGEGGCWTALYPCGRLFMRCAHRWLSVQHTETQKAECLRCVSRCLHAEAKPPKADSTGFSIRDARFHIAGHRLSATVGCGDSDNARHGVCFGLHPGTAKRHFLTERSGTCSATVGRPSSSYSERMLHHEAGRTAKNGKWCLTLPMWRAHLLQSLRTNISRGAPMQTSAPCRHVFTHLDAFGLRRRCSRCTPA